MRCTADAVRRPVRRLRDSSVHRAIFQDRAGTMWVATNNEGMLEYRGDTVRAYTTADGLAHNAVRAFAEDREGALWIGTPRRRDHAAEERRLFDADDEGRSGEQQHSVSSSPTVRARSGLGRAQG